MPDVVSLPELLAERSRLEKEHRGILEQIHELRKRAKEKTIIASDTRRPLDPTEVEFWQRGIKENQTLLMKVQSELGALNKRIRAAQADQPIKTLSQLPREVAVKEEPAGDKPSSAVIQAPGDMKEGYALFLQFFRQLVVENIDPRLVEVWERDAHNLVNAFRETHAKE
jgi:hypothetical protein